MTDLNDRVPGTRLTRGADYKWVANEVFDIYEDVKIQATGPRIFIVPPDEDPKPFEKVARHKQWRDLLTNTYKFPKFLFEKTWYDSNGFAGLRQYKQVGPDSECITVSWLRVLVKIVRQPISATDNDYYWHEMTFLVHFSDKGACTVFCCDIDNRFYKKMLADLDLHMTQKFDWKDAHAILFRQITCEVDHSIWACSKAVRALERDRPDSATSLHSKVEFPKYHDLLRHALHISETLQAACQVLKDWLESYQAVVDPTGQKPKQENHYDMIDSFQLMQSLLKRADSNEARLRNEINLRFNTVSQQDAKAVRIISVVTLLFLPATFVSTLFSMSFFSFQPDYQNGWGVSSKIWIYFAVSVPLTLLTFVIWVQLSRILTWLHDATWFVDSRTWVKIKKKNIKSFGLLRGLWR